MRKVLFILGVLLSLGVFCACSSDDEIDNESPDVLNNLTPIDKGDSFAAISDFFKTAFNEESKPFDFGNNLGNEENPCVIINNEEEFEEVYTGESSLPTIDFSKYTLIIGKVFLSAGTFIDNMNINHINRAKATLSINCIIDSKGAYIGTIGYVYYWNLFPKFHASIINVEVSKKYGEIDDSKKQ